MSTQAFAEVESSLLASLSGILYTDSIDACHSAIKAVTEHLQGLFGFPILLAAELARSPAGPSVLWQTGILSPHHSSTLETWFEHARRYPDRCLSFGSGATGVASSGTHGESAPWITLIADGTNLPHEMEAAMGQIASFASRHLHHLRQTIEKARRLQRLDLDEAVHATLLRASVDLLWEADADGVIRVTHIFHGKNGLGRLIEKSALQDLRIGSENVYTLLSEGRTLRAQRIVLPGHAEPLVLTACPTMGAAQPFPIRGTLCDDIGAMLDRLALDACTLETIIQARNREEQLRRETEATTMGLRVLLGDLSFHEKIQQLARHMANAIGCDDIRVVHVRPSEKPRLLTAGETSFTAAPDALEKITALSQGRAVTILPTNSDTNALVQTILKMREGDSILIALSGFSEQYHIFCRTRVRLNGDAQALAERFCLLLQQAILLQDDQKRMIHTAKLSALGQMSTSIAHELRQPLNTISIAAQNIEIMIDEKKISSELLKERTTRILSQVDRACRVMDRMRRFGRKTIGDHRVVRLAGIVHSARSLMDNVAGEAGTIVEIAVPDDLNVIADELEIEQVLVNLIQNAADALKDDTSIDRRIRIWSADDPHDREVLMVHVDDNGPGFSQEVQKHALDAFFTTKPEGKGTGLGLSIAHTILREHGGRLLIGNWEGGGRVTLMLRRPEPKAQVIPFGRRDGQVLFES
jgi:signal transduction histidine kinase